MLEFFKKYWKAGLVIIAVTIISAAGYVYYYYFINMPMGEDFRVQAEQALNSGITVEDPKNDFVTFGSNKEEVMPTDTNNPSPYQLAYFDLKTLSVGVDEKYFYYKATFYDIIPESATTIGDDTISGNGCKVELTDAEGVNQALLSTDFNYLLKASMIGTYYFTGPTGIEWPEDDRFARKDSDGKVFGGPGTDYLMGAFPLEKLGLKKGDTIHFTFSMEASSKKYTHAAVDVLRGSGKMPALIEWQSGTNQFNVNDDFYVQYLENPKARIR